jgi:hypothetical protein
MKDEIRGNKLEGNEEIIPKNRAGCDRDPQNGTAKAYRLSHLGSVRPYI